MKNHLQGGVEKLHAIFGRKLALIVCNGKVPRRKGWNTLSLADMTRGYLNSLSGTNLGVVCGRNSDGLCALDIDSDEHLDAFLAAVPEARHWPTVRGRRGAKLFVRVQGDYPDTYKLVAGGMNWGEWRSHGANCVVWGNHPDTGTPYTWTNANTPPTIRFEAIEQALARAGVGKKGEAHSSKPVALSTPTTHTSSSASASESCVLRSVPCVLYNSSATENVAAKLEARNRMRGGVAERFGELADLYEQFIERRFQAALQHRNGFIVEAIPFLLHCICPEAAAGLAMMFYDTHKSLFHDSRKRHEYEVRAMIQNVEKKYLADLSADEREVFTLLSPPEQSTFRICRDLARLSVPPQPAMTFFLSCAELASRLQTRAMQAHRILQGFVVLEILISVDVGQRWKAGRQPKASTFQWLLGFSTPKMAGKHKVQVRGKSEGKK